MISDGRIGQHRGPQTQAEPDQVLKRADVEPARPPRTPGCGVRRLQHSAAQRNGAGLTVLRVCAVQDGSRLGLLGVSNVDWGTKVLF